ncbi:hypothetical protein VTP01DRAFT_6815, partial [Rhizomucor pusillus]|uniref:uncharacterized protein n=1 Tax=Rhizomucor pusillus TaxID=4840 RepID=UPI0037443582
MLSGRSHTEAQQKVPVYHDPWARREAWRKHPIFSKGANFRTMFPGQEASLDFFSLFTFSLSISLLGTSFNDAINRAPQLL